MIKECQYCEEEYRTYKQNQKFCSKECSGLYHRVPHTIVFCPICSKEIAQYPHKKRVCCSIKCANKYFSVKFAGEGNPNYGNRHPGMFKHTDETKAVIQHKVTKSWKVPSRMEKHMAAREAYKKIYGYYWINSPESIAKITLKTIERVERGDHSVYKNCKKGWRVSTKTGLNENYHSSYEMRRMIELDEDKLVLSWTKQHSNRISYKLNGKDKIYVPDFYVEYVDGRKELEEVKGYVPEGKEQEYIEKTNSGKKYCIDNGMVFKINFMGNKKNEKQCQQLNYVEQNRS